MKQIKSGYLYIFNLSMEANEIFFNPSPTMHYDDSSPTPNSPNSLLVLLPKSLCSLFRHHTFCQLIQRRFIIVHEQNSLKIHFHILCSLADTPNEVIRLKWMANNWFLYVSKHFSMRYRDVLDTFRVGPNSFE